MGPWTWFAAGPFPVSHRIQQRIDPLTNTEKQGYRGWHGHLEDDFPLPTAGAIHFHVSEL